MLHVIGIDPGLVHTGVVVLQFDVPATSLTVRHHVVDGTDVDEATRITADYPDAEIFIEAYRPRSHFSGDSEMVAAVHKLRAATKGNVLDNTGVLKIVRRPLLELLECWSFSTRTHHQDLRSAARIAVLGMLRSPQLNAVLYSLVQAHNQGNPWTVIHE